MTVPLDEIPRAYITGQSGRLGSVVVKTLWERGVNITTAPEDVNYMVFAHRYRGSESFDAEMMVNVRDVVTAIDGATWQDGDRSIVIVSSVNADEPGMNQSLAYNVSKAALNQAARYYAKSQAMRDNAVRINTVSPATFTGPSAVITAQQVADVIAFLCSPQSSGINGQNIRVTGACA